MLEVDLRRGLHIIRNYFFTRGRILCCSGTLIISESSLELLLLNGECLVVLELVVVEVCSTTAWLEGHVRVAVCHRVQILK